MQLKHHTGKETGMGNTEKNGEHNSVARKNKFQKQNSFAKEQPCLAIQTCTGKAQVRHGHRQGSMHGKHISKAHTQTWEAHYTRIHTH